MKNKRQAKLLELIKKQSVETQEDLQSLLCENGFPVTQATVSRDIRELGIVKTVGDDGIYRYSIDPNRNRANVTDKFSFILRKAVQSVICANNLVVVKTYTGMGSAAGAAIDSMELDGMVGSLAGDDTLLVIGVDDKHARNICELLNVMLDIGESH